MVRKFLSRASPQLPSKAAQRSRIGPCLNFVSEMNQLSGGAGSLAKPVSGRQFPAIREKLKIRQKNSRKVPPCTDFPSMFPRVTGEYRFRQNREYWAAKQGFKSAFQGK